MAMRIDGKAIAAAVRAEVRAEAEELTRQGTTPGLAVILIPNINKVRAYFYTKEFYDLLATKYILPDYDSFFEIVWDDEKGCNLVKDFVFIVETGNNSAPSFIVKDHQYADITLPDISEKGGKLLCMVDLKKSVGIKIYPR